MKVVLVVRNALKMLLMVAFFPCVKVGGYLAFIGLFCLEAGLALSTAQDIQGINTWGLLLNAK